MAVDPSRGPDRPGPPPVTLAGRHVRLEPLSLAHLPGLVRAAGVRRSTYGYTLVPDDEESMRAYITAALADQDRAWALPFATCRPDGQVVGSTRFLDLAYWPADVLEPTVDRDAIAGLWPPGSPRASVLPVPSAAEIGSTWVDERFQRTGVNTEAKLLMLTHAFEDWRVHRVTLKTDARNERSRRAIERLGARLDGVLRAHVPAVGGGLRDSAYYSVLRSEWPDVKAWLATRLTAG